MQYLQQLFKIFTSKKQLAVTDVLIGLWENDLDDSSGLHAIFGWSYQFNQNNTGLYSYWSNGNILYERPFTWQRIHQLVVTIKFNDSAVLLEVNYSIQIIDGPYNSKLYKLIDVNYKPTELSNIGFLDSFGALFKPI